MTALQPGVIELALPELVSSDRTLHVFMADLEALPAPDSLFPALAADERVRAASFRVPSAAASYIRRRWLRRSLLATHHGIAADEVVITSDRLGRPSVVGPQAIAGVEISTSSAGRYALIAWRRDRPLGVDLALRDLRHATSEAACQFMTAREMDAWQQSMRSPELFFRIWARKESILKRRGTGFATDPRSVESLEHATDDGATVADIHENVPAGCLAAIAI